MKLSIYTNETTGTQNIVIKYDGLTTTVLLKEEKYLNEFIDFDEIIKDVDTFGFIDKKDNDTHTIKFLVTPSNLENLILNIISNDFVQITKLEI